MKTIIPALVAVVFSVNAFAEAPKQAAKGDRIPEVSVKAADASVVKLREAVKSKPAVLIFYRGGWCPFCSRHLMALVEVEKDLTDAGFQILAISADQPAKLAETPNREKLTYTLLSDASMDAAKAFGITFKVPDELVAKYKNEYQIDIEAASGKTHHLLPHPAVFIVDREGVIRFAHVNPDYKTRLEPAEILKAARESARPATP
jgi:peroxiredoxin